MEGIFLTNLILWELVFFVAMNMLWMGLYFFFRNRSHERGDHNPFISVIIPVYNKAEHVAKTIQSALDLDYKNKEVIVINDGSTDGSREVCRSFGNRVRFMDFSENRGKYHVLNEGIKSARGELILTMDADSFIDTNALKSLAGHFTDPKVGAVAGVVMVDRRKGILNRLQVLDYFHQAFQRMIQGLFHAVMVLPGPISLYSKSAVQDVGYFEGDTMVEDWDMTMKIHKGGYRVLSDENALVSTVVPLKLSQWWRQRIRWTRGGIKIAKKHLNLVRTCNNKALTRLMFPLHVMWLVVPFVVVPTMIAVLVPSQVALSAFFADIAVFLGTAWTALTAGSNVAIVEFFRMTDIIFTDFMDFKTFDLVRAMGYLSGLAFLSFTYIAIKSFKKELSPKDFFSILFMPVYWMMLNAVYVYSAIKELSGGKFRW